MAATAERESAAVGFDCRTSFRGNREAHRNGEIVLAGALAEPADGALLIFRGESPDVAASFAQRDPYVRHGLVRNWEVRPWTVVVGGESPASASRASGGV